MNEEGNVVPLYEKLRGVLGEFTPEWELLFVDDGSTDGTWKKIEAAHAQDPRVKGLSLSRNFGHQMALTAGLDAANGDAVIAMDADLQHPPELLRSLIVKWKEGYEVVYTLREATEGAGIFKKITAGLYYRIFRALTKLDLPTNAADFRLLDRKVVEAFRGIRERSRFLRGLTAWVGYRSIGIPYVAAKRVSGVTKYRLGRMAWLALDGIVSFSIQPLLLAAGVGAFIAAGGFAYLAFVLFEKIVNGEGVPGWASVVSLVAIVGGIQLIVLGLIGIYVGKIFDEVKARPLYLTREKIGC